MAIRTEKFELGKEVPIQRINRFFSDNITDPTQVLNIFGYQKAPNVSVLMVTYNDVVAPYVVATSPPDGLGGVLINSDIIIQMSEIVQAIDKAVDIEVLRNGVTVSPSGITIDPAGATSSFAIKGAVDDSFSATYVVTLKTTIQDQAGNNMELPHVFSFITQAQISALDIRSGKVTPSPAAIGSGYQDVSFGSVFGSDAYRLSGPSFHHLSARPSGLLFRITNKTAIGFRINFDNAAFPSGADLEWLAILGASS